MTQLQDEAESDRKMSGERQRDAEAQRIDVTGDSSQGDEDGAANEGERARDDHDPGGDRGAESDWRGRRRGELDCGWFVGSGMRERGGEVGRIAEP